MDRRQAFLLAILGVILTIGVGLLLFGEPPSQQRAKVPRTPVEEEPARPAKAVRIEPGSDEGDPFSVTVRQPPELPVAPLYGRVVRGTKGVGGAHVVAFPIHVLGGVPLVETTTDEDGAFRFDDARGTLFRVAAFAGSGFGQSRATGPPHGPVVIELETLRYVRLRFVGPGGEPVDVRGQLELAGLLPNAFAEGVGDWPGASGTYRLFLEAARIDLDVGTNEAVSFGLGNITQLLMGDQQVYPAARTIRLPGRADVVITPLARPFTEWPAATEVRVPAPSGRTATRRYRVSFPPDQVPAPWKEDGLYAEAVIDLGRKLGEGQYLLLLTKPSQPWLVFSEAEPEFAWIRADSAPVTEFVIPCDVVDRGAYAEIRPRYPALAYLDLMFEAGARAYLAGGVSDATGRFVAAFTAPAFSRGWQPQEGHLRAGPLLPGRYRVRIVTPGERAPREVEVNLEAGHNVYAVRGAKAERR